MNLCRDQFRRLARGRDVVSFDEVPEGRASGLEPVDPNPGPGAHAVKSDQFVILQRAIDQLPHTLKAALVLFSLEGHSQKETAEILGTTPKTVELRVYHAKEKLRQFLGHRLGEEV
jgi:RNA polymerase sigma-70 factor (ECF subfamily)